MEGLDRHLAWATQLVLPGAYRRFHLGGEPVGFVSAAMAARLAALGAATRPDGIGVEDAAALTTAQDALADAGVFRKRGEMFDVRAAWDGPALAQVDRGVLPVLGIAAQGVHVNGLVRDGSSWFLWIGRRSQTKALDAGKLDHMVAGGIPAGMDAAATLVKEAEEEASVPEELARQARSAGTLSYAVVRAEGVRRDRLHCFDLELPANFVPVPRDGEVEQFELMPLHDVMRLVRSTDAFKFNVNLVLIDLAARLGLIRAGERLVELRR